MRNIERIKRIKLGGKNAAVVLAASFGALAVIRELGKHSIPTVVIGEEYICKSKFSIGINVNNREEVLEWLRMLPELLGHRPVLLTDADEYVDLIYQHWQELSEMYCLSVHPNNRHLTDKFILEQTAAQMGIRVPKTFYNENGVMENHYPVIVKPVKRGDNYAVSNPQPEKAYICHHPDKLRLAISQLKMMNIEYIIQQMIPGDATRIFTLTLYRNRIGHIAVGFITNKLRIYPQNFGTASVHLFCSHPKLIEYCKRLLDSVQYEGVAEFEFKYCEQSDDFYIIEVNGRFPLESSIMNRLTPSFAYYIYQDLISPSSDQYLTSTIEKPFVWIYLLQDLRAMKSLGINPIKSYFIYAGKYRFRNAMWSWSDPIPTLYFYKYILRKIVSRRKKSKHTWEGASIS